MICLHGIVRNEEAVIRRMINSVLPYVDEFYFYDTGSTDETIRTIRECAAVCTIDNGCFVNFQDTRNDALSQNRTTCPWLLLLDADMYFHSSIDRSALLTKIESADIVHVVHRRGQLMYTKPLMVRTCLQVRYEGHTHEVLRLPEKASSVFLSEVHVDDMGDGGCSGVSKLKRDLKILSTLDKPTSRNLFYLAETHRYLGNVETARRLYRRRVLLHDGWSQERYYSAYQIGKFCLQQDRIHESIRWMEKAVTLSPQRAEPFYQISRWFAEAKEWKQAWAYLNRSRAGGDGIHPGWIFVEEDVYLYLRDLQRIVVGYYLSAISQEEGLKESRRLLNREDVKHEWRSTILYNIVYFCKRVVFEEFWLHKTGLWKDPFYWSTPSFYIDGDANLVVLARINNYSINAKGEYEWRRDYSECRCIHPDKGIVFRVSDDISVYQNRLIRGLEDIRFFGQMGDFTAVTEDMVRNESFRRLVVGRYEHPFLKVRWLLESPLDSKWEKNWSFFSDRRCVYQWWPLTVGTLHLPDDSNKGTLIDLKVISHVPNIFREMRGSTHGVLFKGLYWFITHAVTPSRNYVHFVVALDGEDQVAGYGGPFRFTEGPIEFCNGFLITADGFVLFGYSHRDMTCQVSGVNFTSFLEQVGWEKKMME